MKKMMLTLAIALSTFCAFAGEVEVNQKVLDAFKSEFKTAKEVEWSVGTDYYRATFTLNEKHVYAYYTTDGELLALSRFISPDDLPLALQSNLKKSYNEYWISDLFEVGNDEGTTYFVTVENADSRIVLKATDGKSWSSYRKVKKS